jgi:DNA processing protein
MVIMQDSVTFSEIFYANSQYPDQLRQISSPPKCLYVRGQLPDIPLIAVVGSRRPTIYGHRVLASFIPELVYAGIGIVSGLAYGIDSLAHKATLEASGLAVAVLGNAIDKIYPAGNRDLSESVLSGGGAIISEYPPGSPTYKSNFPARNRIIAGLSIGVLVVEADAESGSLITANSALVNNRQVYAVPGSIFNARSAGPNNLIRVGAKAVISASDILDDMSIAKVKSSNKAPVASSAQEESLLKLLATGVSDSQSLIEQSQLTAQEFASVIGLMEITGKVRNLGAGNWVISR